MKCALLMLVDIKNAAHKILQNARKIFFFPAHAKLIFMADKFTIWLVQMKCTANAEENLTRPTEKIREAAALGAQIISLHELFLCEYFCRAENTDPFKL